MLYEDNYRPVLSSAVGGETAYYLLADKSLRIFLPLLSEKAQFNSFSTFRIFRVQGGFDTRSDTYTNISLSKDFPTW